MTYAVFPPLLWIALAMPAADSPEDGRMQVQYGQVTLQQRIIIRVPRLPNPSRRARNDPLGMPVWKEKKSAKCLPIASIAGAAITRDESVDLITGDGRRYRARFDDSCPAIDFYSGFYLRQTKDGRVCARRDAVRSRSGDECRIKGFKELVRER